MLHVAELAPKVSLATAGALEVAEATSTKEVVKSAYKGPKEIEKVVKSYFKDIPILADIARCESHYIQYDSSGKVHRGVINSSDVGVMQINEKYHLQTAKKKGMDIYSLDGNLAYARYLYKKEGSYPWISSSACWAGHTAVKDTPVNTD